MPSTITKYSTIISRSGVFSEINRSLWASHKASIECGTLIVILEVLSIAHSFLAIRNRSPILLTGYEHTCDNEIIYCFTKFAVAPTGVVNRTHQESPLCSIEVLTGNCPLI